MRGCEWLNFRDCYERIIKETQKKPIPMSSTRLSEIVPFSTYAVKLGPKYDVWDRKVISPGMVI